MFTGDTRADSILAWLIGSRSTLVDVAQSDSLVVVKSSKPTFEFAAFVDLLNRLAPVVGVPTHIEIDLSEVHFFAPSGMVPLVALIDDLVARGWQIEVAPPTDPGLQDYWAKAGWTAAIRGEVAPELLSNSTFTPIASYRDSEELNDRLNTLMDVLAKVSEFEPGLLSAISWTVSELADNVLNHSGGATGWIQIIARPNRHRVEVVVADCGLGVRETLRERFPDIADDTGALRLAIEAGITGSAEGQGNGLAGSVRIAQAVHGWFNILSGTANLRLFADGTFRDLIAAPFQGTVVTMTWPTEASIDVIEALWGHRPGAPFEFTHVTDEGILFKLSEEATGFGNRGTGKELATKLRNIMADFPDERVVIDFENVEVASASFLDEFLAKIIKGEGVTSFFSRFQFRNMSDFVRRTADEVIQQRLSQK